MLKFIDSKFTTRYIPFQSVAVPEKVVLVVHAITLINMLHASQISFLMPFEIR